MKGTKRKTALIAVGLILFICLAILALLQINKQYVYAYTSEDVVEDDEESNYNVTLKESQVEAVFSFTRLNDTECSVKLSNKSYATKAIIPSTAVIEGIRYHVTEIAANGFSNAKKLVRVKLPISIKKIGNSAFASCPELKTITIGDVEEIGNSAFAKCPNLIRINIPTTVNVVGSSIFKDNTTNVYIESKEIDGWNTSWKNYNSGEFFLGEVYLEKIEYELLSNTFARTDNAYLGAVVASGQPDGFAQLNTNTATDCFKVPKEIDVDGQKVEVIAIDERAFYGSTYNVIIENSDNSILLSSSAFENYKGDVVYFNRKIAYEGYGENAGQTTDSIFTDSSVRVVVLPNSLSSIAENMFRGCEQLQNLYFKGFINDEEIELPDIQNLNGEIDLGKNEDNIIKIETGAFYGTKSIQKLHIYSNVTFVGYEAVGDWQESQMVIVHGNNKMTANWEDGWCDETTNVDFTSTSYKITLDPKEGAFVDNITEINIVDGVPDNILPEPKKDHAHLSAWKDKNGKSYTDGDLTNINQDLTLYAEYEDDLYSVDLIIDGAVYDTIKDIRYGQKMPTEIDGKKIGFPPKTGYDFVGYYTQENGGGNNYYSNIFGDVVPIEYYKDDTIDKLFGYYKPKEFNIILRDTLFNKNSKVPATYGEFLGEKDVLGNQIEVRYMKGYIFHGYFENDGEDKGKCYYTVDTDLNKLIPCKPVLNENLIELFAYYEPQSKYIKIKDDKNNSEFTVNATFKSEMPSEDANGNKIEIPILKGNTFLGYNTKSDGTGNYYYDDKINGKTFDDYDVVELFAIWELTKYEIRYVISNNSTSVNNPNAQRETFYMGDDYKLTPAYKGNDKSRKYVWDINNLKDVNVDTIQNNLLVISGEWVDNKAQIVYNLNGGSINSNNVQYLNYGESFTLCEPTRLAREFNGWTCNNKSVTTITHNGFTNDKIEKIYVTANWRYRINGVFKIIDYSVQRLNLAGYEKIILQLPASFPSGCTIVIPKETTAVHIYATAFRNYDLDIVINSRTNDLDLHLENFAMCTAHATNYNGNIVANDTISMTTTNNSTLNLYAYGDVTVAGYAPNRMNGTYTPSYAIKCERLKICHASGILKLKGGLGRTSSDDKRAVSTTDITYDCDKSKVYMYNNSK